MKPELSLRRLIIVVDLAINNLARAGTAVRSGVYVVRVSHVARSIYVAPRKVHRVTRADAFTGSSELTIIMHSH